ncbi:hypothetical protein SAMN05216344_11894, partial [Polaromonas sp. OV174]
MQPKEIRMAFTDPLPVANASAGVTAMPSLSAARASCEEFQYPGNSSHT